MIAFARRRHAISWSTFRPRPGPLGVSFAITAVWLVVNVRRPSPLDVLPFAWTWLTLWLALSVGLELWQRLRPACPRRRGR